MREKIRKIIINSYVQVVGVKPTRELLSAISTLAILLALGTVFYSHVEGWSIVDSFYFSAVTVATVGYGDFHPTTTLSKLFTIFMIFMGVGLGLFVLTSFSESYRKGRDKRHKNIEELLHKIHPPN